MMVMHRIRPSGGTDPLMDVARYDGHHTEQNHEIEDRGDDEMRQ